MGTTVSYTSEVSVPITYQWKCSKCGAINRTSTKITASGDSFSFGKGINAGAQQMASSFAKSQMQGILGPLFGERGRAYKYRGLGLNQACEKCNHKEPWAVKKYNGPSKFLVGIGIFALIGCALFGGFGILLMFFGTGGTEGKGSQLPGVLTCLGIAAFIIAMFFISKRSNDNFEERMDKALRELPMASFPVLVIDGVPVVDVGLDEKKDQQKSAPLSQHIGEKKTDASAKSSSEESFIQNKESTQQVEAQVTSALTDDRVDEIKRYKDLLDCGILTQEEFEEKKKQLLGL